jgi:predicted NACHT family NTPase
MSNLIYNWKRFWCPRGGSISLSFGGYLDDPESEWGRFSNPNAKPFGAIVDTPCLVLLGEPGMGKSQTIEAERKAVTVTVEQQGGAVLWLDLRSYRSEDRLVRSLFESEQFLTWVKGHHRLYIFLDSLDEGLLRIDTLSSLLADELKKYRQQVARLSLRLACRTADWPSSLETDLQSLWGEAAVAVYELAPLRRVDIVEAARVNGIEPESFLSEVERAEVVPLAIKPVTLNFLLKTYQRHGSLPKTQAELYLEGCRLLCEETNEQRRNARLMGTLSADQRLAVAARIAAVSVFANRYAVWTAVDQGEVPTEDVTIRELSGGKEQAQGNEFVVGEDAIQEALGTGLFSSRGPNRLGWAHQTYAEFLAAHYLVQHQMTLAQRMNLIVHPNDPEKKLVPQLHETAAWLAGLKPEVFQEIIRSDPEVLLRSDVATAEETDRAALVRALLEKCDAEQSLLHHDWGVFARFKKLAHVDLAEQLRPYICDSAKSQLARSVAIDIAEVCRSQALESELVQLALDQSQPFRLRKDAAYVVVRIGTNEARAKLKPLALGEAGDDSDDELKGAGLQASWPGRMSAEELFSFLTPLKNKSLLGRYWTFLSRDLASHLESSNLPVALAWVASQHEREHLHPFEKLADSILLRALEYLETPGVVEAFAKAALSRLKDHHEIFRDRSNSQFKSVLENDEAKRRQILETMLHALSETEDDVSRLFYAHAQLVLINDIPWMIDRLQSSTSQKLQLAWARLIEKIFNRSDFSQSEIVLAACWENKVLAEVCAWLLKPIEINSPEAQKARENYQEAQKWQKPQREGKPLLDPPPAQRIAVLLEQCESGDLEAWWRLNREMTLEPDSTHYGSELESDLTTLPGWKTAHSTTRTRIIEAAKKYLLEQDLRTSSRPSYWLEKGISQRPALAGYRALRLLFQIEPWWVSSLTIETWRKWAPIILAYPVASEAEEEEIQRTLVTQAYQHAPKEVVQTLLLLIDEENERHANLFIMRQIEQCWDDYLKSTLLVKMKDEQLRPKSLGRLLQVLLDRKIEKAKEFAETLILLSLSPEADQRAKAITAACLLMTHMDDAGWSIVWPAIQRDVEFGREVIVAVAYELDIERIDLGQRLTENQLADLYIWMVRSRQGADESNLDDDNWSGAGAAGFKNSLLENLKRRGTPQACEAIQRIAKELPKLDWLKWTLLEAQAITRRQTWLPPRPGDILAIASSQQKKLVQSGEQLLDVLIESLQRLEKYLQGETPQVESLWDRPQGVCRPKDENAFSNYVKGHLERDLKQRGIIVNREVEIRRKMGGSPGERVDIQVDAVSKQTGTEEYDRISVIIEVKGCWHEELDHAMKTQLVDRYLNEAHCQHGLYLIGWFNCEQWDTKDSRRGQAPKISFEEARKQFDDQAQGLSQAGLEIRAFVMNTALR